MSDVVCLGELVVDFVSFVAGESIATSECFKKAAGGAPANVAVGLARLGVSSSFMGKVGEDGFGRFLAAVLADAGVDIAPLCFTGEAHTMLAFVSLRAGGEPEFLFYPSTCAGVQLARDDIDEAAIARAKVLHFGSISLISESSRSATLHAVALARRFGKWVSYDPNLRLSLWRDADAARAGLLLGLQHADIVKISVEEVDFLTGIADPVRGGRALWHDNLALMAVTSAAKGCHWLTVNASHDVAGFPVTAVDTTGAGDAFMASLLAGLLAASNIPPPPAALDRICRFANATGAIATTSRGAIPSLPSTDAVRAFIAARVPADGLSD